MDGLGRIFNVVPTADGVGVDMSVAEAVTFVCVGNEAYTLQQATSAAGAGATDLAVVDRYYQSKADGSAAWTREAQAAAAVVDPDDATALVVAFTVTADQLADGFTHLLVNAAAAGLVTAITHDLAVQRSAENLAAVSV